LAAVAGLSDPSLGKQVGQLYGDDHRCWGATNCGPISQPQQPAAGILEPIMQALPAKPLISNLDGLAINLHSCRPGPGQRIQDGMQLGADSGGELAFQLPHAIPALPQLQMPTVLL
jgi:hypothetical protein